MSNDLAELAFLFGLRYLELNFGVTKKDLHNSEAIFYPRANCLKKLKIILSNLLASTELHYFSISLRVTPYFLLLFNENSLRSGLCLKCDGYFSQLDQHFYQFHRQPLEIYKQYRFMFGFQVETYWPFKAVKKQPSIRSHNYFTGYFSSKLNFGFSFKKCRSLKNRETSLKKRLRKGKLKPKDTKNQIDQESFFNISDSSESSNIEDLKMQSPKSNIDDPTVQPTYTCGICFNQIRIDKRKQHNFEHKRNELVECSHCREVFTRRVAQIHKRKCSGNIR